MFALSLIFANVAVIGILGLDDYEIHLPDFSLGYVSFSDISPLRYGFTLCFWLKTTYNGFFIEYKVASEQNESIVLRFCCGNNTFRIHLDKTRYFGVCF